MMIVFVIFHVWQNIEVMKVKMNYRKLVNMEKKILKENDRIVYEIEKFRTMKEMKKFALDNGYNKIEPGNVKSLLVKY